MWWPRIPSSNCGTWAALTKSLPMTHDREALSAVRVNGNLAERKAWMTNLESRLTQASGSLNSSRTKLLAAIVDNAEDNYFLSSRALAKRYDVDKATVVRSIQALG